MTTSSKLDQLRQMFQENSSSKDTNSIPIGGEILIFLQKTESTPDRLYVKAVDDHLSQQGGYLEDELQKEIKKRGKNNEIEKKDNEIEKKNTERINKMYTAPDEELNKKLQSRRDNRNTPSDAIAKIEENRLFKHKSLNKWFPIDDLMSAIKVIKNENYSFATSVAIPDTIRDYLISIFHSYEKSETPRLLPYLSKNGEIKYTPVYNGKFQNQDINPRVAVHPDSLVYFSSLIKPVSENPQNTVSISTSGITLVPHPMTGGDFNPMQVGGGNVFPYNYSTLRNMNQDPYLVTIYNKKINQMSGGGYNAYGGDVINDFKKDLISAKATLDKLKKAIDENKSTVDNNTGKFTTNTETNLQNKQIQFQQIHKELKNEYAKLEAINSLNMPNNSQMCSKLINNCTLVNDNVNKLTYKINDNVNKVQVSVS